MKALIIGALCGILLSLIGAWIAGFNFDSRGSSAFWVFYITVVLGAVGAICAWAFTFK